MSAFWASGRSEERPIRRTAAGEGWLACSSWGSGIGTPVASPETDCCSSGGAGEGGLVEGGGGAAGLGGGGAGALAPGRGGGAAGPVSAGASPEGTVASSSALLSGLQTTLEDAIDDVDAVNEDEESLLLLKNQNLASNALASLSVFQQQQLAMVNLIKQLAGLD